MLITRLLVRLWRLLKGLPQWYILWFVHDKFIIGVSGVILDEQQRVLLLRHRYWKPGSWGLPSGYAEKQETMEETLRREVLEETGYHIEVDMLLKLVSGYRLRVEMNFLGRLVGGELHIDHKEVIEARFFALDALPEGLLPSHRAYIAEAFSRLP